MPEGWGYVVLTERLLVLSYAEVKERRSLEKEYKQKPHGFPLQSTCFSCQKTVSIPMGLTVYWDRGVYGPVSVIGLPVSPAALPSVCPRFLVGDLTAGVP